MREKLLRYLQSGRHIAIVVLGGWMVVGLVLLLFSPYRIHDWVEENRYVLMWSEIVVLLCIAVLFANDAADAHNLIDQLSEAEKREMQSSVDMYNFYDEKGELKLSVKPEKLYYLEAADNYVKIHYLGNGKMEKLMIRNTLKNIEWRFRDKGLVRCHRSFIVNLNQVQVLRRHDGEVLLDFGEDKVPPIPVSKGYGEKMFAHFAK